MPDRRLHPAEVEAILRGEKHLPGIGRHAMRRYRDRLGMGVGARRLTEGEIALRRLLAYTEICPHKWEEQPCTALPDFRRGPTAIFSGYQIRHCFRCAAFQSRMWTVNGYATEWQSPVLPVKCEVM